jgi:hypothetical protein
MIGDAGHEEFIVEREFQTGNLLEYLVYEGLQAEAVEILTRDYEVRIVEYNGQVLIECDAYRYYAMTTDYSGFYALGKFMMEKEVKFSFESSSFFILIEDFMLLCDKLLEEE